MRRCVYTVEVKNFAFFAIHVEIRASAGNENSCSRRNYNRAFMSQNEAFARISIRVVFRQFARSFPREYIFRFTLVNSAEARSSGRLDKHPTDIRVSNTEVSGENKEKLKIKNGFENSIRLKSRTLSVNNFRQQSENWRAFNIRSGL